MVTSIDAKEQVYGTSPRILPEGFIQTLVARIGRAPDLVLEWFVNILLACGEFHRD